MSRTSCRLTAAHRDKSCYFFSFISAMCDPIKRLCLRNCLNLFICKNSADKYKYFTQTKLLDYLWMYFLPQDLRIVHSLNPVLLLLEYSCWSCIQKRSTVGQYQKRWGDDSLFANPTKVRRLKTPNVKKYFCLQKAMN